MTSGCGNKDVDLTSVRSEIGLALIPNSSRICGQNFHILNPVDPAGPYCYRGRTKTCKSCVSRL
ncbi:MAG: hypothetical protein ACFFCW_21385, partial [Candidatus Hodarchaeota archaeon]